MFQPISLCIGLRYGRSQKGNGFVSFITFFSIIGIMLGVSALITVVSVMDGLEAEQKRRVLGLVPHVLISPPVSQLNQGQHFNHWQDSQKEISKIAHVDYVTPYQETEALIQSPSAVQAILVHGIVPRYEKHNIINQSMVSGDLSLLKNHRFSIVIGQALAQNLQVNLGDEIRIILPNKTLFTPMGRVPVQRTFKVNGIFNVGSQVDESIVYINIKDGAKLLRQFGDGVNQLRIYLDDAFYVAKFIKQFNVQFPNMKASSWQQSQGALFAAVSMEKHIMWLMLSLIIAVAAFNIISALVMVVIDKKGEISILQTLGLNSDSVVKIFITQGIINGIIGVFFGVLLGVIVTLNINTILTCFHINLLGSGQQLPVVIDIDNILFIVFSSVLMCLLATLYPSYRAAKTQPAEVLRHE